ncbi:MAG TPA: nitrous oxide reductase accessory protein NosL [Longimicrobiales bacterium]|nr:nitrous oxide reductase accessory protein NosL [Longimicrobiales bacterium]
MKSLLWRLIWKLRRHAGMAALSAVVLAACAAGPDPVHWGVEECARCRMVISDERFAGQVVDRRGNTYAFDAIECMAAFLNDGTVADADVHSVWIADGRDGWVAAGDATFIHSPNIRSPMGGGLVAHADAGTARRLQEEVGGDVLTWQDVLARLAESGHSHAGHPHAGETGAGGH